MLFIIEFLFIGKVCYRTCSSALRNKCFRNYFCKKNNNSLENLPVSFVAVFLVLHKLHRQRVQSQQFLQPHSPLQAQGQTITQIDDCKTCFPPPCSLQPLYPTTQHCHGAQFVVVQGSHHRNLHSLLPVTVKYILLCFALFKQQDKKLQQRSLQN